MKAWERIVCGDVPGTSGLVAERIRYSVFVAVDVAACFWYGVILGRDTT
jgi:hypothetical protein